MRAFRFCFFVFFFLFFFVFCVDRTKDMVNASSINVTKGKDTVCNMTKDLSAISPCQHEEADTKLFVYTKDAIQEEYKTVINGDDTGVVVITVSAFGGSCSLETVGRL